MKTFLYPVYLFFVLLLFGCSHVTRIPSEKAVTVPLGGNTYLTVRDETSREKVDKNGLTDWTSTTAVYSAYFRITQPGKMDLFLKCATEAESEIKISCGTSEFEVKLPNDTAQMVYAGSVMQTDTGYVRVDIQGIKRSGATFARISGLTIDGDVTAGKIDYVGDFSFYWGRRGPSVHLNYPFPENETIEWFYNEVTVPTGEDPVGSYYMANGFGEGYFGIQVNGTTERRVLFSVWSPFNTDDPKEIPEEEQIKMLKKGEGVYTGEFGNEGSGGQSYLVYPWITGNTYKFLTHIRPDNKGATEYTAYFFAPETGQWKLVAQFLRPKTNTYYKRAHSFLESFNPELGYLGRKALYGNQWARTTDGRWLELTTARFSADETARKQARMDYKGGQTDGKFYLQNCGFLSDYTTIGSSFTRPATGNQPEINWDQLD